MIAEGMTDDEAYAREIAEISAAAEGQLWNTHGGGRGATSDGAKAKWADPEYRARQLAAAQKPEVRAKKSEALRRSAQSGDIQSNRRASQRAAFARPESNERKREAARSCWQDPAYRQKISDARKAGWADPGYRAKRKESLRSYWEGAEARAARSARYKAAWQDPEFRERVLAARRATRARNAEALK